MEEVSEMMGRLGMGGFGGLCWWFCMIACRSSMAEKIEAVALGFMAPTCVRRCYLVDSVSSWRWVVIRVL